MVDHDGNLPIDDRSAEGERASLRAAGDMFEPRFLFRAGEKTDLGTDASIELKRQYAGDWRATGIRAWCQVKHTSAPQRLSDGSLSHPIDTKNINYLRYYSCPFYLLYSWPTKEMFFRWHHDVLEELKRERPDWNKQTTVKIRFSRRLDSVLLEEIALELESYAEQIAQLADGPKFIRSIGPERARRLLEPDPVFIGRCKERKILEQRIGRGRVVPIIGEPDAGKREFVRQSLCDSAMLAHIRRSLDGPLALIVLDPSSRLEPRILRSVAYAIGLHKSLDIESNEALSIARARATLMAESLPARVQGQRLLAVIENAERCLDEPRERSDLDELLSSEPFRSGCALIITPWGSPPNGKGTRVVQPETRLSFLPPDDAVSLLRSLGVEHSLSSSVVDKANVHPELLLPGVIKCAAGAFAVRTADGQASPTDETLINELLYAREYMVTKVLAGLGVSDQLRLSDASPAPLGALIAVSFLGRYALNTAELNAFGLSATLLGKLHSIGWIEEPIESFYRLTDTGYRSLRMVFQRLVDKVSSRDDVLGIMSKVLRQLLGMIATRLAEDDFDKFSQAVEEAIAWVHDISLEGTQMDTILTEVHLPYTHDDVFFPIPPEKVPGVQEKLRAIGKQGSLASATAELALAIRSAVSADEFLIRLREAVSVAANTPQLLAIHVRVLDFAAFLGAQRYHQHREILRIRQNLLCRMLELNTAEASDIAVLKWSASWLLNTATIAARTGEIEVAQKSTEAARVAVDRLPQPRTAHGASDRLWLTSRLAQIEGRLSVNSQTRIEKLREAEVAAFEAIARTPSNVRWVRFALRAAHRLSEELRTDDQRDQLLGDVDERLTTIFGDHMIWPLTLKTQVMALARDTAALNIDPERRIRQVRQYLDRFNLAMEEAKSLAHLGDARPLLVLARSYAFAAACHDELDEARSGSECRLEALHLTQEVLYAAPSVDGWALYLRLLDQEESSRLEGNWHTDPFGGPLPAIGSNLCKSIDAARVFLSNVAFWGGDEGRLAIWCLQREWKSQGSLERCAAKSQYHRKPWNELTSETKRQVLKRLHGKRQAALKKIELRTGPFLELYVLRMQNEAQLQRLLAIYSNHITEIEAILQHLKSAKQLWPDSYALLKEEGRFQRYIWNYPSAIEAFRRVVKMAPSGYERREAMLDLVEVILTAVAHCEKVRFADKTMADRVRLIAEAQAHLAELRGFRHVSREVAMLCDRADLEAGVFQDWGAVDEAFNTVIGDVDAYTTTLVSNIDDLLARQPGIPEHLADLVVANFTSPAVLRDFGWFYLRRVDLGGSSDPSLDCQKAYAVFQACRILEMACPGSRGESTTTSYQRGRAILTAAKATGKLTPFQASSEGKRNLVHLAEGLFGRTVGMTVGLFHLEAKRRHSEASRLQHSLRSRA